MRPAFSVIFLTTLIGAGQGLFLALVIGEVYMLSELMQRIDYDQKFFAIGAAISVVLTGLGLVASFFHLGHPERAWMAANQWRTSWLSREVIALPVFMAVVAFYGAVHFQGAPPRVTLAVGLVGVIACFALFICTGMVYACIKFLREWATPLTLVNFTLLGCSSGFILAAAYAGFAAPRLAHPYAMLAVLFTTIALLTRSWSLQRNSELAHNAKSTTQTAIGVRHTKVVQTSMGQMGGSFNTREFFHGKSDLVIQNIRTIFLVLVFPVPIALVWMADTSSSATLLALAFVLQYIGLLAERWFFFAQSNHPQNLYYQKIS